MNSPETPPPQSRGRAVAPDAFRPKRLFRIGFCLAGLATAACGHLGPAPSTSTEYVEMPAPAAEPSDPLPPPAAAAPVVTPAPQPVPPEPPAEPPPVLVVSSSASPTHSQVADALAERMAGSQDVVRLALEDVEAGEKMPAPGSADAQIMVAIGEEAASLARERFPGLIVVCQVLDLERQVEADRRVFGVEALPPPELQLKSWRRLAADADTVGIIVGTADAELATEARSAAAAVGLELLVEHASSDQEVLYRFKRLAHRVDGLWLLPNEQILSPGVLRELFGYARERGVHTIVFNAAMLEWGALLSVGSDVDDIVATVESVVAALARGDSDSVPRITPLPGADVRINPRIAAELGLGQATTRVGMAGRPGHTHAL